jgi:hypothetical protein
MHKKRIIIFSPETKDQEGIAVRVTDNLKEILRMYPGKVEVKKFSSIGESLKSENRIGSGGEILVVFDKYVQMTGRHRDIFFNGASKVERLYVSSLKAEVTISKHICEEEGIPYIEYEGEIERGREGTFRAKIKSVESEVLARLVNGDSNF